MKYPPASPASFTILNVARAPRRRLKIADSRIDENERIAREAERQTVEQEID